VLAAECRVFGRQVATGYRSPRGARLRVNEEGGNSIKEPPNFSLAFIVEGNFA
jgi:hypothetical protein